MHFERKTATGRIPVFGSDAETASGGFLLDQTGLTPGSELQAGTPLVYDEATRVAKPIHAGRAQASAASNAVNYRVNKGHTFAVGDNVGSGAIGGKAYDITTIDKTNAAYDTLTLSATIGAVAAGDLLFASTAAGATASALPAANGLLYDEVIVRPGASVSAVIRGTAYARRIPVNDAIMALPGLSHIIFSQSR